MASSDPDELGDPYGILVDCLEDPDGGKERLPRIVSLFESDERVVRLCAAWTCSLLANELDDDDTIDYLVRRLSDRLDEEYVSLELTTTLDYISTRYSDQVETILEEMDEEGRERGSIPLPRVGNFTRSNYYNQEPDRDGVGRTQVAGSGDGDDPRAAYADREREEREQDEYERGREESESGGTGADDSPTETDEGKGGPMAQQRTEVSSIATRSRFDKLHILATRQRNRYADIYEALVSRSGGEEEAVALRLLHQPDDASGRIDFARRTEEQLRRWAAVSDHTHIMTVLDWGADPRPWLSTQFSGESLADIDRIGPARALTDAINLADAVSYLHQNDVVHAGLDPGNVIYPDDIVETEQKKPPFLDNVSLMSAFRFHFEPALHLDPRFAAPEYFDDQYGRIDHATDIYQLGAVLYQLFTGQPPFSGEFQQVRESVLHSDPPRPSTITDDLPPAVDDVISKAMARQKLTRYETVEHLEQELISIRGGA